MKLTAFLGILLFLLMIQPNVYAEQDDALFAGGCFWCMEPPFKELKGVTDVISGYAGGTEKNPTYQNYASKGYTEAIRIIYDPSMVSYSELLDIFWRQIDPTDANGQFCDRGEQYKPAIYYYNEQQKITAEDSKNKLKKLIKLSLPISVEILPASTFYPAEEYHQNYYRKNPAKFKSYKLSCGRDKFLKNTWGKTCSINTKIDKNKLTKQLSPLQYKVTQENETEEPFNNQYHDNNQEGIYVDIVSGEPLFASTDKFESGTGWPSFTKPIEAGNITEREDVSLTTIRTEVRSKQADSHLGHVFTDGPKPTGLRYCINSASLRFIPKKDLETEGYGQYKNIFKE